MLQYHMLSPSHPHLIPAVPSFQAVTEELRPCRTSSSRPAAWSNVRPPQTDGIFQWKRPKNETNQWPF